MTATQDLIVIGAGMAGVAAANKCASQGWKVAIVDELPYGGTCALRGCDPKKIRGAEVIDSARLNPGSESRIAASGDWIATNGGQWDCSHLAGGRGGLTNRSWGDCPAADTGTATS